MPDPRPQPETALQAPRWRRLAALWLLAIVVLGAAPLGWFYGWIPPYTWRGWAHGDRQSPPAWSAVAPQPNAHDAYRQLAPLLPAPESTAHLARWLRDRPHPPSGEAASALARARGIVGSHPEALAKLSEGAATRYARRDRPPVWAEDGEMSAYLAAATLGVAAGRLAHLDGDDDRALAHLVDVAALGANLANGEAARDLEAGSEIAGLASPQTLRVLHAGEPSTDGLRRHLGRVRELRHRVAPLRQSLAWEAARADAMMGRIVERPLRLDRLLRSRRGPAALEWELSRLKAPNTRWWLADRYARLIEEADRPPRGSRYAEECAAAERAARERGDWLSATLLGRRGAMSTYHSALLARLAGQEVTAALELYRREHGAYPATLTELAPAYLPDVPADPFTGDPLVYRRTPEGYTLYSLGTDMQDDGGVTKDSAAYEPDLVLIDDRTATRNVEAGTD